MMTNTIVVTRATLGWRWNLGFNCRKCNIAAIIHKKAATDETSMNVLRGMEFATCSGVSRRLETIKTMISSSVIDKVSTAGSSRRRIKGFLKPIPFKFLPMTLKTIYCYVFSHHKPAVPTPQ